MKKEKSIIKKLKEAANAGDIRAMYKLGFYYDSGNFVELDHDEANKWYKQLCRQAIKAGSIEAIIQLSKFENNNDYNMNQNLRKLYNYYESVEDSKIQLWLGKVYRNGWGIKKDEKKANKFFNKAIDLSTESNDDRYEAYVERGNVFLLAGLVEKKELKCAINDYEIAAQNGNNYAKRILGNIYFYGWGVEPDYVRARELYEQVKEDEIALENLANIYFNGLGVSKNLERAKQCNKQAEKIKRVNAIEKLLQCEMQNNRFDLIPILVNELSKDGKKEYDYYFDIFKKIGNKRIIESQSIDSLMDEDIPKDVGGIAIIPHKNYSVGSHTIYDIETFKKIKETTEKFLENIPFVRTDKSNEYEVFEQICKKIAELISYDEDAVDNKESKNKKIFTSRNLIGALLEGKCVCAGYAELLRNLCACRGIECIYVRSNTHAFNQVKLNGKWYWFDMTNAVNIIIEKKDITSLLMSDEEFWLLGRMSYIPKPTQEVFQAPKRFKSRTIRNIYRKAIFGNNRAAESDVVAAQEYMDKQRNDNKNVKII